MVELMDLGSFLLGLASGYGLAMIALLVEDFVVKKRY